MSDVKAIIIAWKRKFIPDYLAFDQIPPQCSQWSKLPELHNHKKLTFVATAKIAIPWRIGCQAPMSWAFSGTMRRNWVVIFQASTRISNRLLTSASTGASGKDATNSVTKPNWITVGEQISNTRRHKHTHTHTKSQLIVSPIVGNMESTFPTFFFLCFFFLRTCFTHKHVNVHRRFLLSYPFPSIHKRVPAFQGAEAGNPVPSEE